jgi:nicotinamidase-related amidase
MKHQKEALIIVDMQNDFGHINGALYVKGGETIASNINTLI